VQLGRAAADWVVEVVVDVDVGCISGFEPTASVKLHGAGLQEHSPF
jgi:hypothetical protein